MPNQWVKWKSQLKVDADTDGDEVLFNVSQDIPREELTSLESTSGAADIAAAGTLTIPQGGITTSYFLYLETTQDCTFDLDGDDYQIDVKPRFTNQPGICMMMCDTTAIVITMGATAGRVKWLIAGV